MKCPFMLLLYPILVKGWNVLFEPPTMDPIRSGESSTVSVTVAPKKGSGLQDSDVWSLSAACSDRSVCKAIVVDDGNLTDTGGTFFINITGTFIGVTELKLVNGSTELASYKVRVLRSAWEYKKSRIFIGVLIIVVPCITFLLGTRLEWEKITNIWKTPVGPITGLVCQFLLMPLLAFVLAVYVLPADQMAVRMALFIAGTCPGGGKSNIWTALFEGNLDLSVCMTFTSNLVALGMMPLWMSTLGREFETDHLSVPYMNIFRDLVALFLPTVAGMLFIHYKRHLFDRIQRCFKCVVWTGTAILIVTAIWAYWYIVYLVTWQILLCGCVLPWSGYLLAYVVATITRQSHADRITIAIETGIQQVSLAMVILMRTLPEPEVDLTMVVLIVIVLVTDKPLVVVYVVIHGCSALKKRMVHTKLYPNKDVELATVSSSDESVTVTKVSKCVEAERSRRNSFF